MSDVSKRYQSSSYATNYKEEYTRGIGLKHLRSRIISHREISIIKKMLDEIQLREGSLILDTPCGTGKLGTTLSQYPIKILAGDLSRQMMDLAAGEYAQDHFVGFLRSNAQSIPFQNESVDNIICLRLFQRLSKDIRIAILKEFRRVAKEHLIVSYSYDSFFQRARWKARNLYDREKAQFFHQELKGINAELEDAGFSHICTRHVLFGLSSEIIILAKIRP